MYVGMVLIILGAGLLLGSLTALLPSLLLFLMLACIYIPAEEKMMAETFGPDFDSYCRKVRRWI